MLQMLLERGHRINGVEQILLSVTTTQEAAISPYRVLGFKTFGCEPRARKNRDRYVDEEYMMRRVERG